MDEVKFLEYKAKEIRCLTSKMFLSAGFGHLGGAFSIVEALSVLFFKYMKDDPKDWFVLSKGHSGPSYYATLSLKGYIKTEDLMKLNQNGTIVPSHPDRLKTPGVDCSTGSLGQGISQAVGLAYGLKVQNKLGNVYCILGDGEFNEGEVWEALQFVYNKKLDNLIIFVDNNKKQVDGYTKDVSCNFDFEKIGELFKFNTIVIDGNNIEEVDESIKNAIDEKEKASFIVMNTIKGCGIKYFEESDNCHHIRIGKKEEEVLKEAVNNWERELEEYENK